MSNRQTLYVTRPGFVMSPGATVVNDGRQVSWDDVPDKYRATAVLVKAAEIAAADATDFDVDALLGDIPVGTILYFGESKEFAMLTAAASAGDTNITVQALPSQIEDNDEAYYGGVGAKLVKAGTVMAQIVSTGKVIPRAEVPTTRASAVKAGPVGTGDGAMTLATPATSNDVLEGVYQVRCIEAVTNGGSFVVEAPDGKIDGIASVGVAYTGAVKFTIADGATDFAVGDSFTVTVTLTYKTIGLLMTDADENMASDAVTGYGIMIGGAVYENLLPEATGTPKVIDADWKRELQQDGVGNGWSFHQYADNRS